MNKIRETRELCHSIKEKKDKMIGHILHHNSLTKSIIKSDVEGNIERRRPRVEYMKQIMIYVDKDS